MYERGRGFNSHTSEDILSVPTSSTSKVAPKDAKPAAHPGTEPAEKPAVKPAAKAAVKPVPDPAVKPAAKPKPAVAAKADVVVDIAADTAAAKAKPRTAAPAPDLALAAKPKAKPEPEAKAKPAVAAAGKAADNKNVPAVHKPAPPPKTKPTPAPPGEVLSPAAIVKPPAGTSRFQGRHAMALLSFLVFVVGTSVVSGWYLWTRAADQYASHIGFSVRAEEGSPSISSLLGPLDLGGSSTPDADILYLFIQSQDLVARIDAELDLRNIWSKVDPSLDPIFAYSPPGTIEELLEHWKRKVRVVYDTSNGLIEVRVLAFTPEDAQAIAAAILAESTALINDLSNTAREDAIGYARDELSKTAARLKQARLALTEFRNRTQIVDPSIDLQGQASILYSLQQQLAETLISFDLLSETTREGDPRIAQVERRIKVIKTRIDEEKSKLGIGTSTSTDKAYASLVGEYESLVVDREFAEQSYTVALVSFDSATSEAVRQTRYLAAHVRPTLAEKSEYPRRETLLGVITLFAFLLWSVLALVTYSLRDRR